MSKQPAKPKKIPLVPKTWHRFAPVIVIAAIWVVVVILVDPRGNFTLNDDWGMARAVRSLVMEHNLHYVEIITMTMIAQVLWGAMFCKLFGFSLTILRVSTLVLGLAGVIATYGLLRLANVSRRTALIGCLALMFNPMFLQLSYTFMSDVPFVAFSWIAVYFYAVSLKKDSLTHVLVGTFFAVAATLTRQLGALLPIAFVLGYIAKQGFQWRRIPGLILPLVATFGSMKGFEWWLGYTGRLPLKYNMQLGTISKFFTGGPAIWMAGIADIALHTYLYVGLFLLPVLVAAMPCRSDGIPRRWKTVNAIAVLASIVAVSTYLIQNGKLMPIMGTSADLLQPFWGIGPFTLRDVFVGHDPNIPKAPISLWVIVTIASVLGGALLTWRILEAIEAVLLKRSDPSAGDDRAVTVLALSSALAYLGPMVLLITYHYLDRYFISVLPFLAVIAAVSSASRTQVARSYVVTALCILLLFGYYSIAGTHDYLAWNRVRWRAAGDLVRAGIPISHIDGGFEFNGWYNYREGISQNWWHMISDDYSVSFGPMRMRTVVQTYSYPRWLPPGQGRICTVRKNAN